MLVRCKRKWAETFVFFLKKIRCADLTTTIYNNKLFSSFFTISITFNPVHHSWYGHEVVVPESLCTTGIDADAVMSVSMPPPLPGASWQEMTPNTNIYQYLFASTWGETSISLMNWCSIWTIWLVCIDEIFWNNESISFKSLGMSIHMFV